MDYDLKLSKVQHNARQIERARINAEEMKKDPNYPEEQKKWLKAAKLEKPYDSTSQPSAQPKPPHKIEQIEPSSQQDNWMTQRHDPFRISG
jgi:hypothetical protein